MANLSDFLCAYKSCHNVDMAQKETGFAMQSEYPKAGFYVYALVDPANKEIFYIGKGIAGRVLKHEERTRRGVLQNKAKVERIQKIFANGQDAEKRILFCGVNEDVVLTMESLCINELQNHGITNIVGESAVKNKRVCDIAESFKEKLSGFRGAFAGM